MSRCITTFWWRIIDLLSGTTARRRSTTGAFAPFWFTTGGIACRGGGCAPTNIPSIGHRMPCSFRARLRSGPTSIAFSWRALSTRVFGTDIVSAARLYIPPYADICRPIRFARSFHLNTEDIPVRRPLKCSRALLPFSASPP